MEIPKRNPEQPVDHYEQGLVATQEKARSVLSWLSVFSALILMAQISGFAAKQMTPEQRAAIDLIHSVEWK